MGYGEGKEEGWWFLKGVWVGKEVLYTRTEIV